MSANVIEVTDDTFEAEVLQSKIPVLVDMWASWCGPCRMVAPVIEELAAENSGKVKICKINVDDNHTVPSTYGVSAIPTVLVFKNGEEVENLRMVGAQPRAAYQKTIDQALA